MLIQTSLTLKMSALLSHTKLKIRLIIINLAKTVSYQNKNANGTEVFVRQAPPIIIDNKINNYKQDLENASRDSVEKNKENY